MTAQDLQRLGLIDGIVPEPVGGAHRNWEATAANLRAALRDQLWELKSKSAEQLVEERYEKFRRRKPEAGERIMRNLAKLLSGRLMLANAKVDILSSY